jgi:hypothetical protein
MNLTRLRASSAALALAIALSGCAGSGDPTVGVDPAEPTSAPEVTQPIDAEVDSKTFTMPADCTEILPVSRADALAAQGITLVGGPGAEFEEYLPEPTREELAGGMSCFWEDAARPNFATFTISVAPVSSANRDQIIADLSAQGLNVGATSAGFETFWISGDEQGRSAVHNVVTPDAWVSVVTLIGGPVFYDEAVVIADEVISAVYR